jgi:iron complex outermembrane recepter protein
MVSLWCLTFGLSAQSKCDLTLSGQVVDEHDGSALGFANVFIENSSVGTISDASGYYSIAGICPGVHVVVCSHVGCEPVRDTLLIEDHAIHNFYPEHHAELLDGISIVESSREPNIVSIKTRVPMLDRSAGKSLGQSLEGISGVSSLSTGNSISKPIIHGLHSNRILVINNGVRQEGQQWGNEHAPEIDAFIAGEIQVYKGAQSVRFGPDAIGGVILVMPKSLPDSFGIAGGLAGSWQSNGLGGSGNMYFEGRAKKIPAFRWRAQGSAKRLGDADAPEYVLTNTGIEELNFSLNASFGDQKKGIEVFYSQFNTNLGILSASHIGNLTDFQRALEADEPLVVKPFSYAINRPYQHVEHELFKASAHVKTKNDRNVGVVYSRQYNLREEYDTHKGAQADAPGLQFEIVTHGLDVTLENKKTANHDWQFGASGLIQENTFEGRYFIPAFRKGSVGVFGLDQMQINSNWSIEFGGRMDYVEQSFFFYNQVKTERRNHSYAQPSVTAGLIRKFGSSWHWKLNTANSWRPPSANELYSNGLHHGAASFEIGDTNLRKEMSYSLNTALMFRGEHLQIETEAYLNFMDGFIYLMPQFPATLTIRGAFPTFSYGQTSALLYGLDNQIRYKIKPWMEIVSRTSILRARDLETENWIIQMPADQSALSVEFSGKMREYSMYVSPSVKWVNKQWRVPSNSDYSPPPAGYLVANVIAGVSRTTRLGDTQFSLEINNLLNQQYRDYMNRYRYYADEIGRNIIVRIAHHF